MVYEQFCRGPELLDRTSGRSTQGTVELSSYFEDLDDSHI
jgi:hypothetical protein